jgi:putative tryptophan/tyrosine transport system substrate-binding protein
MRRLKLAMVVLFVLVGCARTLSEKLVVGVIQFGDFASLNDTLEGLELYVKDMDIALDVKSAQGESANVVDIANQFVRDDVDLIVAITTQSAQVAISATLENKIPVVFACVSDPEGAGVLGFDHVTGVSDAAPLNLQFDLIESLTPNTKRVGVLFKTGDPNGVYQTKLIAEEGAKRGIEVISKGAMEASDLALVAAALAKDVDAFYLITDSLIVGNTGIIVEEGRRVGVYSFASEDGQFEYGILASNSISYIDIGQQVGGMVKKILVDGMAPSAIDFEYPNTSYPQISKEVARDFDIDIPKSLEGMVK